MSATGARFPVFLALILTLSLVSLVLNVSCGGGGSVRPAVPALRGRAAEVAGVRGKWRLRGKRGFRR